MNLVNDNHIEQVDILRPTFNKLPNIFSIRGRSHLTERGVILCKL